MIEKLNTKYILKDRGFSNSEDSADLPRHRWYYYKEGFSPKLVTEVIDQVGITNRELIIDPFNGSGTTTLTASLLGFKSIGIEVNPFTTFLSDTKTKNADLHQLNNLESKLLKSIEKGKVSPLTGYSTFTEKYNDEKWLFNNSVLNGFEGGWNFTNSISSYNNRRLIRLALISAAMKNCNATKDGKCLRYRETWKANNFNKETFIESLLQSLSKIKTDVQENPITVKPRILKGDCRKILKESSDIPNFNLCITSPPYLNTFDYTDIYRPELFLGKFIHSPLELYKLRFKTVRSHIQVRWDKPIQSEFGMVYKQTMKHVLENENILMHKQIPIMIQAYFEDILNILRLLKVKAAKNAQVWFIVSNSAYADLEVPVDLIIGELATKAGWYLKEIGVMRYVKKRKTRYSPNITELRESVVILANSKF